MKTWLCGVIIAVSSVAVAMEDTSENRLKQAERYLNANPPQDMFQSIADTTALTLSPKDRQPYTDMLTKHLDLQTVSSAMKSAMMQHFTADELSTLADFYSKAEAKSAMNKMNAYMLDVMPVVQTEMLKAQTKSFGLSGAHANQAGITTE